MSTANISPAGSSTYDSSTMFVGDGTWDSSRNSFLLPNLQGLNFATMQYNGMGNRFRDLPQYHTLVTGHAVVAAITFAVIVPAAIFIARFGFFRTEGRLAFKMHIYLQILTVFLATVVLTLGWFAVGPERSLTNPHHGIGVAIYVCILVQFLYGWWFAKRERKRKTPHPTIPLRVHIHRLFGRSIALLAFIQIALGLTLYGSPKALFVVYTLWGALLIFLYLALEYRNKPRLGAGGPVAQSEYYSEYSESYVTGDPSRVTDNRRRRDSSRDSRGQSHWGRKVLAGAGALGAYEWWKGRRDKRRDTRDDHYEESEMSHYPPNTPGRHGRPPSSMGPPPPGTSGPGYGPPGSAYGPPGRPQGPPGPPPGVLPPASYATTRPPSRGSHRPRRHDETVLSPQSWENDEYINEKYGSQPPRRSNTWRDRILGAGAGIAAVQGVKSMFGSRKRRHDGYVDSEVSYRPGDQSRVSQTDVSRVQAGQAPFSPSDPRQSHPGHAPPKTPTRPSIGRRPTGRTPVGRTSVDSMSYDDDESYAPPRRDDAGHSNTLRNSIATLGMAAGFREWNKRRKERNEQQRTDRIRQQELDEEEKFNLRNSNRYPRAQDASGRRPSESGTLMTGPEGQDPAQGSNPVLSRHNFRPDTSHPPLPAAAGTISSADGAPADLVGQGFDQNIVQNQQQQQQIPYNLPPPPPGPPPHTSIQAEYPQSGSLQMPQGAVNPDPSRLMSDHNMNQQSSGFYQDGTSAAATEAAAIAAANAAAVGAPLRQRTQSQSPSRRRDSRSRMHSGTRRTSSAAASGSRLDSGGAGSAGSPPVSVKVNMHPDGRHVTLRRLGEEEAAAERATRRRERRSRRASSLSSGGEEPSRYRRDGGIRPSSQQPIANVPPPPAMSSSLGGSHRPPSELNLPPVPPVGQAPHASGSPHGQPSGLLPAAGPAGSGAVGSPGNVGMSDMGTGTDVSAFDNNRRRRRAERARRAEAAKANNRVEFE
ncbi:hypothetical protein DOTSEDRAFT_67579 [Dothistroma septosporum NZE10]|uniref:Cytochrome b561 domain-containing protein n=1 Tax=Dothistroma septosporum (strain NZE10 / CBS 128990) TaxID=675120 RepID=N1PYI8_DOTSN|nr:hypothetical protein DOTSEDRAFT_67579 [Dothistroma septosporum NZE10]